MVAEADRELRIRLKLMELRKFEDKSEQQANIIKSGQVDLWLKDLHQEMASLLEELDQRRSLISQQAGILAEIEKNKIDRVIINQVEVFERELRILKKQTQDSQLMESRLSKYNSKLRKDLFKGQQSYLNVTKEDDERLNDIVDLDFEANQDQYWRLLRQRDALSGQVTSLNETVKR
jgi:hypothetical protein